MNILYILGNGFDKAQGMATGYPDFYRHLTDNVKDRSILLDKMMSAISENTALWSDMECGLGEFTIITNDTEEFDNFYFELNGHLQNYLKTENDKFIPTDKLKNKFNNDLVAFDKYLGALDKVRYGAFVDKYGFSSIYISVITLNYTDTLEKILGLNAGDTPKGLGANIHLQNIVHIHGQLENSIIIGVDGENQIKNESFRSNDNIRDCMIKMQSNQVMKETRHLQCKSLIETANLIVLMGVSLGDTDAYWWKLIGKSLVNRKNLAIIQHLYAPDKIRPTQMQKRGRLERRQQDFIMQKMRIKEESRTEELRGRLFFTINESVFRYSY